MYIFRTLSFRHLYSHKQDRYYQRTPRKQVLSATHRLILEMIKNN